GFQHVVHQPADLRVDLLDATRLNLQPRVRSTDDFAKRHSRLGMSPAGAGQAFAHAPWTLRSHGKGPAVPAPLRRPQLWCYSDVPEPVPPVPEPLLPPAPDPVVPRSDPPRF